MTATNTENPAENTPDPKTQEVLDHIQRASDDKTSEFLGEEVKNNKVIEDKPEDKPTEDKPEVTAKTYTDEDLKKERLKAIEEFKQQESERIAEEKKTKSKDADVDEELQSPWAKEGREPKSYDEVSDWAVEKRDILEKRARAAHEEQEKAQKAQMEERNKQTMTAFNTYVDEQLNELYSTNKLPRIQDKENPNDYGLRSRKALFQTMMDVNGKRATEGKPPIYSIKEIFYEHYKPPGEQPAGADAPVSAGAGGGGQPESQEIDYIRDIRGKGARPKSFIDIALGR